MKHILIILLCIGLTNPIYSAELEKEAGTDMVPQMEILHKGEKAKFDGIISNAAQMKRFRQINEERKLAEEKVEKLEQLDKIRSVEIEYYKDNYMQTKKELDKEEKKTFYVGVLAFIGGVLLTAGVGAAIILVAP